MTNMEPLTKEELEEINDLLLCQTTVSLQDDKYRAFLLLYTNKIEMIALNLSQTDRIRRYSWPFSQIKKVVKADILDRNVCYLYLNDRFCDSFEVTFMRAKERDAYMNRINMLIKLYQKSSRNSLLSGSLEDIQPTVHPTPTFHCNKGLPITTKDNDCMSDIDSKIRSVDVSKHDLSVSKENSINNDIGLNMFSPDNLKKLAAVSSQESMEDIIPELANEMKSIKINSFDAKAELDSDNNLIVPVEINVPNSDCSLAASAKMKLKLNIDAEAFKLTEKMKDRSARIARMRELIEMDVNACELLFE